MAELRAALEDAELKLVIAAADLENEKETVSQLVEQIESYAADEVARRNHEHWYE